MKISIYAEPSILAEVKAILNHPMSWWVDFKFVRKPELADFKIYLRSGQFISNRCGFSPSKKLSCASRKTMEIFIDVDRWNFGSDKVSYSLAQYRTYLINHEVGHLLGLNHEKPTVGLPCPVMHQQTLGLYGALPNVFPLIHEQISLLTYV